MTPNPFVALGGLVLVGALAPTPDLFAHPTGLWSLQPIANTERWLEIHNLNEAQSSGIFHIDVLSRQRGTPAWQIKHLAPHLAITRAALERSVVKPLQTGSVYPESFDSAYQAWLADEQAGKRPFVCDSSVDQCLRHEKDAHR